MGFKNNRQQQFNSIKNKMAMNIHQRINARQELQVQANVNILRMRTVENVNAMTKAAHIVTQHLHYEYPSKGNRRHHYPDEIEAMKNN